MEHFRVCFSRACLQLTLISMLLFAAIRLVPMTLGIVGKLERVEDTKNLSPKHAQIEDIKKPVAKSEENEDVKKQPSKLEKDNGGTKTVLKPEEVLVVNKIEAATTQASTAATAATIQSDLACSFSDRFLLLEMPMHGGLHNQLMAFLAYGLLAANINRTLVLPQFKSNFPTDEVTLVEYDTVWNLSAIQNIMFPFLVVQLRQVPICCFKIILPTFDFAFGRRGFANASMVLARSHHERLVVARFSSQWMYGWLFRQLWDLYNVFQLNQKLSATLDSCFRFISGRESQFTSQDWQSIVVIHLRIEEDWLQHSRRKSLEEYKNVSEIQKKFQGTDLFNTPGLNTIVLSYARGKLPALEQDLHDGWPARYRVVTCDDLDAIIGRHNYLERSAIMSRIAFHSGAFVGNKFSSFSQVIAKARRLWQRISFWYTTPSASFVRVAR